MELSIIIPVLNDATALEKCLGSISSRDDTEVIVVDGGSNDESVTVANRSGTAVIASPPGRAKQMNAGAKIACGEKLLFLHADAILPTGGLDAVIHAGDLGCFRRKFIPQRKLLDITCHAADWRAEKTFIVYGDQGIFLSRALFEKIGGYREMKHFEDVDLARRAAAVSPWEIIPHVLLTDGRRFGGTYLSMLNRILQDAALTLAWLAGWLRE